MNIFSETVLYGRVVGVDFFKIIYGSPVRVIRADFLRIFFKIFPE